MIHIDYAAKDDCYNLFESYGEICVGCGCCSKDTETRLEARIALHERLLEHDQNFDEWDENPELKALQKHNVAVNIAWNNEHIEKYKKELEREQSERKSG